ncbi:hypothetical protein SM71_05259 [Klebsiella pneumoniae]|nr:hypothetical protein SM71_05259 [Klebsiella pneumoniae]KMH52683.1 hypothetical protein SM75_05392 [Klebsiella pneumoniae]KMH66277.1 hypothetical protein SM77_05218 [Klebsiella pneumoniae]
MNDFHILSICIQKKDVAGAMRVLRDKSEFAVRKILEKLKGHCCKVSDEAAFCLIQRPYISKTLLTRRISPRGSP